MTWFIMIDMVWSQVQVAWVVQYLAASKVDPLENTSEGSHLYYFHFQLDTTKGDN